MNILPSNTHQGDIGGGVVEQLHGVAVQTLLVCVREDLRQRRGHHRTRREYCIEEEK